MDGGRHLRRRRSGGVPYPIILKPAVNHHFFPQTNIKALPADNAKNYSVGLLNERYIPADEILVQERIPGAGEPVFLAACKGGHVNASLVAQRRRQYPWISAMQYVRGPQAKPSWKTAGGGSSNIGFDGIGK